MGQYYKPVILKKNWKTAKNPVMKSLLCYDYGNGAKLMEHSYIGNTFVRSVEFLLAENYGSNCFVWIGDYADEVETKTGNHYIYGDAGRFIYKNYDSDNDEKSKAYLDLVKSIPAINDCDESRYDPYETIPYYRYLVNYTKREYCVIPKYNRRECRVHPLPLLTCSGNGRGGGDYRGDDNRIGSWAFDRIGITNDKREIEGFKEISGKFRYE